MWARTGHTGLARSNPGWGPAGLAIWELADNSQIHHRFSASFFHVYNDHLWSYFCFQNISPGGNRRGELSVFY